MEAPTHPGAASGSMVQMLSVLFVLFFILTAISPNDREAWLLENLIVFMAVPGLIWVHRNVPLSRSAYLLIFLFLVLHEIGAHYTYSKVPYDQWSTALTGTSISNLFGLERNHYDRLLHLLHGLLLTAPTCELLVRVTCLSGQLSALFAVSIIMATAMLYELLEWAAAIVLGGDLGIAYLGTQGDVWDAHHDMALASIGAIVTLVVARCNHVWSRRYARIARSRIKRMDSVP